jgi:hypothetical protein
MTLYSQEGYIEKILLLLFFTICCVLSPFSIITFLFSFGVINNEFFEKVSTNVYAIKLLPFVTFSVLVNSIFVLIQYGVIRAFRKKIDIFLFFSAKFFSLGVLAGYVMNFFHLEIWVRGMELNIMGFIGFPILLLGLVIESITGIIVTIKAAAGKYDVIENCDNVIIKNSTIEKS